MAEAKKQAKTTPTAKIKITLVKSTIGRTVDQIATVEALGLKKIGQSKIHNDNPAIQGMVFKVKHLICVEKVK